jgi:Protein of unknown function (DUF3551)
MRAAPAALLALMAIGTVSAIEMAPAEAHDYGYGYGYPAAHDYGYAFCLRTRWGGDDCRYSSYQQCQWTASGLGADCFANPALAYAEPVIDEPAPRRHHRHHRDY